MSKGAAFKGKDEPDLASGRAYAAVAALLHESKTAPPDALGSFLAERTSQLGLTDLSVYVTDFEQRHLVPIPGASDSQSLLIDDSQGGRVFTSAKQSEEATESGTRVWSVVVDGAARLGVISMVFAHVDDDARLLADSLAGVVAALLVTRGQCTDVYTNIRRSEKVSLAAEMQWQLLPPLSLDSGRISVAGLIQPAYEVGGDSFDYAINGNVLEFAVFDAMGHGLESSQLAHLAVTSYRHSRRCGLDLADTVEAMDAAVAQMGDGEKFVTCIVGRLDASTGGLDWINVGHPLPILLRRGIVAGVLACEPTLPAGLGGAVAERAHTVMQPGDRICCITDGVLDCHRPGGEDFGEDRLRTFLSEHSIRHDAAETVRLLTHTVIEHHGVLSDDATVFLVEYR
ncbi:MAG TPA: PP2C family protein-serine/threonine phosphatase [Acidimicrobiales bacterium]|nr:PP2C family protein-serine/threonine phosphatase [Acidimicrobiales bacterium]